MAEVVLKNITRRFQPGQPPALSALELTIGSGEFMVLVGPSGCGKSTALRIVAGLDEADEGEVTIAGQSMRGVAPQDRDVAMVFQSYALYPHMKVRDIMGFPLKMRGMEKTERTKRVEEAADMLSIRKLLERRPHELSGGERQRVAMGRAIVRRPKVFLFDEPLSNLDAALRAEIRVEIGTLVRRFGATTLYVTHDHVEAMTLGHRIAIMRSGKLEQVGTPREVYGHPSTAFVASFLGSPAMNLNPARWDGSQTKVGTIALALKAPSLEPSNDILLGIRPEHIGVGSDCPSTMVRFEAVVVATEPLGAETYLHLDAGGARFRTKLPGLDAPAPGERVPLFFDPAHIHAFDAKGKGALIPATWEVA